MEEHQLTSSFKPRRDGSNTREKSKIVRDEYIPNPDNLSDVIYRGFNQRLTAVRPDIDDALSEPERRHGKKQDESLSKIIQPDFMQWQPRYYHDLKQAEEKDTYNCKDSDKIKQTLHSVEAAKNQDDLIHSILQDKSNEHFHIEYVREWLSEQKALIKEADLASFYTEVSNLIGATTDPLPAAEKKEIIKSSDRHTTKVSEQSDIHTTRMSEPSDRHTSRVSESSDRYTARISEPSDRHTSRLLEPSDMYKTRMLESSDSHSARTSEPSNMFKTLILEPSDRHTSRMSDFSDIHMSRMSESSDRQASIIAEPSDRNTSRMSELSDTYMSRMSESSDRHMSRMSDPSDRHTSRMSDPSDRHTSRMSDPSDRHMFRMSDPSDRHTSRMSEPSDIYKTRMSEPSDKFTVRISGKEDTLCRDLSFSSGSEFMPMTGQCQCQFQHQKSDNDHVQCDNNTKTISLSEQQSESEQIYKTVACADMSSMTMPKQYTTKNYDANIPDDQTQKTFTPALEIWVHKEIISSEELVPQEPLNNRSLSPDKQFEKHSSITKFDDFYESLKERVRSTSKSGKTQKIRNMSEEPITDAMITYATGHEQTDFDTYRNRKTAEALSLLPDDPRSLMGSVIPKMEITSLYSETNEESQYTLIPRKEKMYLSPDKDIQILRLSESSDNDLFQRGDRPNAIKTKYDDYFTEQYKSKPYQWEKPSLKMEQDSTIESNPGFLSNTYKYDWYKTSIDGQIDKQMYSDAHGESDNLKHYLYSEGFQDTHSIDSHNQYIDTDDEHASSCQFHRQLVNQPTGNQQDRPIQADYSYCRYTSKERKQENDHKVYENKTSKGVVYDQGNQHKDNVPNPSQEGRTEQTHNVPFKTLDHGYSQQYYNRNETKTEQSSNIVLNKKDTTSEHGISQPHLHSCNSRQETRAEQTFKLLNKKDINLEHHPGGQHVNSKPEKGNTGLGKDELLNNKDLTLPQQQEQSNKSHHEIKNEQSDIIPLFRTDMAAALGSQHQYAYNSKKQEPPLEVFQHMPVQQNQVTTDHGHVCQDARKSEVFLGLTTEQLHYMTTGNDNTLGEIQCHNPSHTHHRNTYIDADSAGRHNDCVDGFQNRPSSKVHETLFNQNRVQSHRVQNSVESDKQKLRENIFKNGPSKTTVEQTAEDIETIETNGKNLSKVELSNMIDRDTVCKNLSSVELCHTDFAKPRQSSLDRSERQLDRSISRQQSKSNTEAASIVPLISNHLIGHQQTHISDQVETNYDKERDHGFNRSITEKEFPVEIKSHTQYQSLYQQTVCKAHERRMQSQTRHNQKTSNENIFSGQTFQVNENSAEKIRLDESLKSAQIASCSSDECASSASSNSDDTETVSTKTYPEQDNAQEFSTTTSNYNYSTDVDRIFSVYPSKQDQTTQDLQRQNFEVSRREYSIFGGNTPYRIKPMLFHPDFNINHFEVNTFSTIVTPASLDECKTPAEVLNFIKRICTCVHDNHYITQRCTCRCHEIREALYSILNSRKKMELDYGRRSHNSSDLLLGNPYATRDIRPLFPPVQYMIDRYNMPHTSFNHIHGTENTAAQEVSNDIHYSRSRSRVKSQAITKHATFTEPEKSKKVTSDTSSGKHKQQSDSRQRPFSAAQHFEETTKDSDAKIKVQTTKYISKTRGTGADNEPKVRNKSKTEELRHQLDDQHTVSSTTSSSIKSGTKLKKKRTVHNIEDTRNKTKHKTTEVNLHHLTRGDHSSKKNTSKNAKSGAECLHGGILLNKDSSRKVKVKSKETHIGSSELPVDKEPTLGIFQTSRDTPRIDKSKEELSNVQSQGSGTRYDPEACKHEFHNRWVCKKCNVDFQEAVSRDSNLQIKKRENHKCSTVKSRSRSREVEDEVACTPPLSKQFTDLIQEDIQRSQSEDTRPKQTNSVKCKTSFEEKEIKSLSFRDGATDRQRSLSVKRQIEASDSGTQKSSVATQLDRSHDEDTKSTEYQSGFAAKNNGRQDTFDKYLQESYGHPTFEEKRYSFRKPGLDALADANKFLFKHRPRY